MGHSKKIANKTRCDGKIKKQPHKLLINVDFYGLEERH
jgi:hypothetical protein